ncbi:galactose oxidase [Gigaspora margarita]|uniref:Galactose oxidase n=1 Tax=Gigaspora margarita TaxID=4874 RepID=A0A8H3XA94_GIGMA|nr:galactose oxidase [Gigaspora margarita]
MENPSLPNHPSKRSHVTATLIPDGRFIYIGGVTQSNPGDNGARLLMTETANSPNSVNIDPRVGHTAVLGITRLSYYCHFGGTQDGFAQITAYPVFILLDVKSEPFQYLAPTPSGSAPPPLAFHTATLYQKYMIVAFGNITNDFGPSNNTSAYVYLMDLSNYTWVTQFGELTPTDFRKTTPTDFGKTTPTELAIIICSIVASLLIIGAIVLFCYIRKEENEKYKCSIWIIICHRTKRNIIEAEPPS